MISKTKVRCGKCDKIFYQEENLGTLQCFDTYYSVNHKKQFKIRADHIPMRGRKSMSIYDWQSWVWTFDDNQFVEANLLKKMVPQPDKLSIVALDEYNYLYNEYVKGLIQKDAEHSNNHYKMVLFSGEKTLDDDSSISDEYDSYDEETFKEESNDNIYISEGIIKEVCIARFDWREKFKILLEIKKIDNDIENADHRPVRSRFYYETIEFRENPHLRQKYFDQRFSGFME